MAGPRMFIVAGPPGGGKSSFFALSGFADHVFNADDRAAELNGGSYENIPTLVRSLVNREFEEFIGANIHTGASFAIETTLRSTIPFEQARLAREHGFRVSLFYVAVLCRCGYRGAPYRARHAPRRTRGSFGKREHAAKNPREQSGQPADSPDPGPERY